VEKDQSDSPALTALEASGDRVIQGNWRLHIDAEVAADLRKYRSYRGESVRDLLRALRNKVSEMFPFFFSNCMFLVTNVICS